MVKCLEALVKIMKQPRSVPLVVSLSYYTIVVQDPVSMSSLSFIFHIRLLSSKYLYGKYWHIICTPELYQAFFWATNQLLNLDMLWDCPLHAENTVD